MFKHVPAETLPRLHLDGAGRHHRHLQQFAEIGKTEKRPTIALITDRRACGKPW